MNRRHLVEGMAIALLLGWWSGGADAASTPILACPFSITVGGTYGLQNDVTASGDCITIAQPIGASVTVNLNGFTITGDGTGAAIVAPNPGRKISVVGPGAIAGFQTGVDLNFTTDVTVKRLNVSDTSAIGIVIGQGSVTDSSLSNSGGSSGVGVATGDRSTVTNVTASDNYIAGIDVGARSSVTQSTADNNLIGILTGEKSRVKSSATRGNFLAGIVLANGSTVTESTISGNDEGIAGGTGVNVNKNAISGNGVGVDILCPGIVQQNTFMGNGTDTVLNGEGCTVKNNTSTP